jgi:hypothetical protein
MADQMTFTINATTVSCERCQYNAQYNWEGHNVCGSGCYELLMLASGRYSKEVLHSQISKLIGNAQQDIQDAIGNVITEDKFIKIPSSTYSRYYPETENWVIQLSKYHRDNLMWLFDAIDNVPPFHLANTGDWNGEIPQMLYKPDSVHGWKDYRANETIDGLKNSVAYWLTHNGI